MNATILLMNESGRWLVAQLGRMSVELAILAGIVLVAVHVLRVKSPALRHLFWGLLLAKPVVTFLVASPLSLYAVLWPPVPKIVFTPPPVTVQVEVAPMRLPAAPLPEAVPSVPVPPPKTPPFWRQIDRYGLASAIWVLAASMLGLRLLLGCTYAAFLRSTANTRRTGVLAETVAEAAATLHVRRRVAIATTTACHGPVLAGIFRPVILLPETMAAALTDAQLKLVITHELAHAKRWDNLVLLIQRLAEMLFFFHPVVWLCGWMMRREAEAACDDMVMSAYGDADGAGAVAYADSLTRVAEMKCGITQRLLVSTFAAAQSNFTRRIHRILGGRRTRMTLSLAIATGAVLIVIGALGLPTASSMSDTSSAAVPEKPGAEMLTLEVHIADEAGAPVAGALVKPYALRTRVESGSHYGWRAEVYGAPEESTTNGKGVAQVRYPKYVEERLETGKVSVEVSHPLFVPKQQHLSVEKASPTVALVHGTAVRVSGYVGDKDNIVWPVHVMGSSPAGWQEEKWQVSGKSLENHRLSPGRHHLWLIYQSPEGALLFSDTVYFDTAPELTPELAVELHPGARLEGRLDGTLPHPIKNGRAEIQVASVQPDKGTRGPVEFVCWRALTNIAEDGSFSFDSLPKGYAEIAAWCEGGIVAYNSGNDIPSLVHPVPIDLTGTPSEAVIPMTATASVTVKTEDPQGRPLEGVKVSFWPNVQWQGRITTVALPSPVDSLQMLDLDSQGVQKAFAEFRKSEPYAAQTGPDGQATVPNLPPCTSSFYAKNDAYELPSVEGAFRPRRMQKISLEPGKDAVFTARLQPKGTPDTDSAITLTKPASETPAKNAAACASSIMDTDAFALPTTPTVPPNRFEGRVVGEDGAPLAGVLVDAMTWYPGNETTTDANGAFALANVCGGEHSIEVRFSKDGYSPVYMFRQSTGRLTKAVTMSTKTYIEGKVADSAGSPVSNATIRADGGPRRMEGCTIGDTILPGSSRADGTYRVYVQEGTYTMTVTNGTEMAVVGNVAVAKDEAKSLEIRLSPAMVFRAKVVDSVTGAPVEGIRLYNWRLKEFEGTSNDRGELAISGLPNGNFEFSVDGEKRDITRWWSKEAVNSSERFSVNERDGWQRNFDRLTFNMEKGMAPVTVTVERGVHVRGTVVDPDGKPVEGATVAPARTGTSNSLTGDTRFSGLTVKDGSFDLLLPASKDSVYNLICHDGDFQEWRTWANGSMEPMTTKPGEVREGVVLQLQRPCTVRGRVVDAAGKPVSENEVRACAFDRKDNRYYVPDTKTDKDGNFELKYVAPGKHFVQAAPHWLNPEEAPAGSSRVVEAAPEKPVEGVELISVPDK